MMPTAFLDRLEKAYADDAWQALVDSIPKTVTVTVDYLRSSRREDIFAAGEVTKLGRRVASVSVVAWSRNRQRPIGETRTHFLVAEGGKP